MKQHFIFSVIGSDRPGLVDRISEAVVRAQGNLEDSRMAVLGSDFVIMMLCSVEEARTDLLKEELARACQELDLALSVKSTTPRAANAPDRLLRVHVRGMDHEGIVHQIAHYLVQQGGSVESLESHVSPAPHTGTPMFHMDVRLAVPASASLGAIRDKMDELGQELAVDVEVDELTAAVR